jgi:hypothetical protein
MKLPTILHKAFPENRSKELLVTAARKYQGGDFKGAFFSANAAVKLWADNKEAWALAGAALAAAPDEERRKLFMHPDNMFVIKQQKFWAGWIKLQKGEYTKDAWSGWDDRFNFIDGSMRVVNRASYWDGRSSLAGKTMFLDLDGGLGDILQFGRCAPIAKAAGARLVAILDRYSHRLIPLLTLCSAIDEIIPVEVRCRDSVPPHDIALTASSFPLVLATTTANIPPAHWLLEPPQERLDRARTKIGQGGFKIGLSWAASQERRNLPLRSFAELATIPGVRLFGLQRGAEARELEGIDFEVTNLEGEDTDIVDTAAAMCELDLVITADTMTCHLAGSLGRPCWTLLPSPCDWRWIRQGSTTPWYPSMRLARQLVKGDWSDPLAEVVAAVRAMVA